MTTCISCGADLPPGAMFCGECGSAVIPGDASSTRRVPALVPAGVAESAMPSASASASVPASASASVEVPEAVLEQSPEPDPQLGPVPDERTRLPVVRDRPAPSRFVLQFSTGECVTVTGSGLIGRRPALQPGEDHESLVAIDDPSRSVSKTHLEFGQEGGTFWVSDRFSANGTVVREPDRPARLAAPGMRSRVPRGSRVEIGEQFFVVS